MAKGNVTVKRKAVEATVNLELTLEEAMFIKAFVGNTTGSGRFRVIADGIYESLTGIANPRSSCRDVSVNLFNHEIFDKVIKETLDNLAE